MDFRTLTALIGLAEWDADLFQDQAGDAALLLPEKFYVVVDRHRFIASDYFMLASETWIHHVNSVLYGKFDRPIVASHEMQERDLLMTAPVTSIDALCFMVEKSQGDILAGSPSNREAASVRKNPTQQSKKRRI